MEFINDLGATMMCSRSDPDAKPYELLYFPISGLAEPIRLALALGGLEFIDTTPQTDETFADRKAALSPYGAAGQVPVLVLPDGATAICQSRAILRYLGKIVRYEGAFLYPTEPMEAWACDALMDLVEDMQAPIRATLRDRIPDQAEKEAARAALLAPEGKIGKWLKVIDGVLAEDEMTTLTIGHLYCYSICNLFRQPTFLDGCPPNLYDDYANINKHHDWVATMPEIKAYFETKEGRDNFKPLAPANGAAAEGEAPKEDEAAVEAPEEEAR